MGDLKSELPFAQAGDSKPLPVLEHARIIATSKTYGWDGLYVEVGENRGWQVADLVPIGHYIAINRLSKDFHIDALQGDRWVTHTMPPGSLWVQPAHYAFSFNVAEQVRDLLAEGASLAGLGWLTIRDGDYRRARAALEAALPLLRAGGDQG